MKKPLLIISLVLAGIVIPFGLGMRGTPAPVDAGMLPWMIEQEPGGTRVFGLRPGRSLLQEAIDRFGPDAELAIIAGRDEIGAVEAYYSQATLGFISGRIILAVDVPPAEVTAIKARAQKAEFMESGARKIAILAEDRQRLLGHPVRAIVFIPSVNLDEATLVQRFGPPGERIALSEKRVHLLYPGKGLEIVLDGEGKEMFQYVAPAEFEKLRAPLLQAAGS